LTGFVIHFHGFWKDVRLIDIVEKFWCKYSSIVDQISMFPKYIDAEPYIHGTVSMLIIYMPQWPKYSSYFIFSLSLSSQSRYSPPGLL